MSRYVLKSRTETPSCGWFFRESATGWQVSQPKGIVFTQAVNQIIAHRLANPGPLAGKATDPESVAEELDAFICAYLGNADRWCKVEESPLPKAQAPARPGHPKSVLARLAAAIELYSDGAKALIEWFGVGGVPVADAVAEKRADLCRGCWKHKSRDPLTAPAAEIVLRAERVMQSAEMELPGEPLGSCGVCGCHLPLKVWVPRAQVEATRDPGHQYPGHCWVNGDPTEAPAEQGVAPGPKTITVQRWAARGDVIAALPIVSRLKEAGYRVRFSSLPACLEALKGHPDIDELVAIKGPEEKVGDINLDGTYERSKNRATRSLAKIMFDAAEEQASQIGITLGSSYNLVPSLAVTPEERAFITQSMARFPRPWVAVIPRSNAFVNKTVPQDRWDEIARQLPGYTLFWTGTDPLLSGRSMVDLNLRSFRMLMAAISVCDVVATVDTGPMWVAQALQKPMVYIAQSGSGCNRVSDQVDWEEVRRPIPCINCNLDRCPINETAPPCSDIDPQIVADAVRKKVNSCSTRLSISAVVPLYKPNLARLRKCLDATLPQVDEVVLSLDGPDPAPEWLTEIAVGKVRLITHPSGGRQGYGHTCNRGARISSGTHLLMLNDDCFMDPGAVQKMASTLLKDSNRAVVGCLLRYADGKIQHGGGVRGPQGYGHIDHMQVTPRITSETEMEFVTFASVLIPRSTFFSLRGFDERYDCYHEDSDFCLRARAAGWSVWYNPAATGIHEESLTSGPMKQALYAASRPLWWARWAEYFTRNAQRAGLGEFSETEKARR